MKKGSFVFFWVNVGVFASFFLLGLFLTFYIYQSHQDCRQIISNSFQIQKKLINENKEIKNLMKKAQEQAGYKERATISELLRSMGAGTNVDAILFSIRSGDICIDGGAHDGKSSDAMAINGATVYAFEPNPELVKGLNEKYKNTKNIKVMPQALGDKKGNLDFVLPKDGDAIGGTISTSDRIDFDFVQKVPVIRLVDFIQKEIVKKGKRVYVLKLDVEGAEFDILPDLIKSGAYKHIDYIIYEPHERLFPDGQEKRQYIEQLIEKYNVKNIYPIWP